MSHLRFSHRTSISNLVTKILAQLLFYLFRPKPYTPKLRKDKVIFGNTFYEVFNLIYWVVITNKLIVYLISPLSVSGNKNYVLSLFIVLHVLSGIERN